jgi:hypothetical protein
LQGLVVLVVTGLACEVVQLAGDSAALGRLQLLVSAHAVEWHSEPTGHDGQA